MRHILIVVAVIAATVCAAGAQQQETPQGAPPGATGTAVIIAPPEHQPSTNFSVPTPEGRELPAERAQPQGQSDQREIPAQPER